MVIPYLSILGMSFWVTLGESASGAVLPGETHHVPCQGLEEESPASCPFSEMSFLAPVLPAWALPNHFFPNQRILK